LLSECIMPYTLSDHASGDLAVSAVLMLVFQQCTDASLHTLIVESLMARKRDVYEVFMGWLGEGQ